MEKNSEKKTLRLMSFYFQKKAKEECQPWFELKASRFSIRKQKSSKNGRMFPLAVQTMYIFHGGERLSYFLWMDLKNETLGIHFDDKNIENDQLKLMEKDNQTNTWKKLLWIINLGKIQLFELH